MGAGTRGLVLLGFLAMLDSCETQSCTEMGCVNGAALTLRRSDGTLPAGAYTLRLTIEGRTHACSFSVPADLPTKPGQIGTASCDPPFDLSVYPEVTCTETRSGDAVSQSCTPLADHWYFNAVLEGTPSDVGVVVERDGAELMSEQRTLSYRDEFPNGPECGGACRRANADFTLAD